MSDKPIVSPQRAGELRREFETLKSANADDATIAHFKELRAKSLKCTVADIESAIGLLKKQTADSHVREDRKLRTEACTEALLNVVG